MSARSRTRWLALVISLAAAVVLALIASELFSTDTEPGSETTSLSDDYSKTGLAAWAKLLVKQDHKVYTTPLASADEALASDDATIILIDAQEEPTATQNRKLAAFVRRGGHVVIGGENSEETAEWLLGESLLTLSTGPDLLVPNMPRLGETMRVDSVVSDGGGSFGSTGKTIPVLRGVKPKNVVVVGRKQGDGWISYLADTSPLMNKFIGKKDNANFATDIANNNAGPVYFADNAYVKETPQPSEQTGLNALSTGWKAAIIGLAFALFIWMLARGHRFGPVERPRRELPPPRRKFVEAQAATLAATKQRAAAATELWEETRSELQRRCGLSKEPSEEEIRAAAEYIGLSEDQAGALVKPPSNERPDSPILVGQAYAKLISRNQ